MINRKTSLNELYERIKSQRTFLGLQAFKHTPTSPVRAEDLPCIFMTAEIDSITEHAGRSNTGYPVKRVLEVVIEIAVSEGTDIMALYSDTRKAVFCTRGADIANFDISMVNPIIAHNTFIMENRSEGPVGYGQPDAIGMRLILDLMYSDEGF